MNGSRPPRSRFNRPLGDRMPGDRSSGDRSSGDRSPNDRNHGDRNHSDRPVRRPSDSSRYHDQQPHQPDSPLEQRIRELDAEREPLSLAEEITGEALRRGEELPSRGNPETNPPLDLGQLH